MSDHAEPRRNMVDGQIKPNKVTDPRLLGALSTLPREIFVPKAQRGIAYIDEDLHIGNDRYVMEPMILARLVQEAEVKATDMVLQVGVCTGYATAVLARLCATVVGVEESADLVAKATDNLATVGVDNALVIEGAPALGHAAQAPYDVVLFDGAIARVPDAIADQLAPGGRMVAVLSDDGRLGQATLFVKSGGVISHRPLFDAATPLLPGFEPEPVFEF